MHGGVAVAAAGGGGGAVAAGGEPLASRHCLLLLFPLSELTFDCLLREIIGKASLGFVASLPLRRILLAVGQPGQSWPRGRR